MKTNYDKMYKDMKKIFNYECEGQISIDDYLKEQEQYDDLIEKDDKQDERE